MEKKPLIQAICNAKRKFSPIIKDAVNPHLKNKYASLATVIEAVDEALASEGILLTQTPVKVDGEWLLNTRLINAEGEILEGFFPIIVQKNDMQGWGSAVTYARRYGLMGLLGLAAEDDDGQAASQRPAEVRNISSIPKVANSSRQEPKPASNAATAEEVNQVRALAEAKGKNIADIEKWLKKPLNQASDEELQKITALLNAAKTKTGGSHA